MENSDCDDIIELARQYSEVDIDKLKTALLSPEKYGISIQNNEDGAIINIGDKYIFNSWNKEAILTLIDYIQNNIPKVESTASKIRKFIGWQCMGGGIGAGFSIGIFRAILAPWVRSLPTTTFWNSFWPTAFLGAALTLGINLPVLFLEKEISRLSKKSRLLTVITGAVLFWLGHLFLALSFTEHLKAQQVAPMGFWAGIGISVVLFDHPWLSAEKPNTATLIELLCLRPALVAMAFLCVQFFFTLNKNLGSGIVLVWTGSWYKAQLGIHPFINDLESKYPQLWDFVELLDATIIGFALAFGIITGLLIVNHRNCKL